MAVRLQSSGCPDGGCMVDSGDIGMTSGLHEIILDVSPGLSGINSRMVVKSSNMTSFTGEINSIQVFKVEVTEEQELAYLKGLETGNACICPVKHYCCNETVTSIGDCISGIVYDTYDCDDDDKEEPGVQPDDEDTITKGYEPVRESKLSSILAEIRGMKWEDLKSGTFVYYGLDAQYQVTKISGKKARFVLRNAGKSGSLFANKFDIDKKSFESQVKTGLIKYLRNTAT